MEYYEIVVKGQIDKKRSRDFSRLEFKYMQCGDTLLSGMLIDQAELFSVINKIRDMNLILISIEKGMKDRGYRNENE